MGVSETWASETFMLIFIVKQGFIKQWAEWQGWRSRALCSHACVLGEPTQTSTKDLSDRQGLPVVPVFARCGWQEKAELPLGARPNSEKE